MIVLPQMHGALGGGGVDPYFSNVVLLCHFDGANGSTTYANIVYPTRGNTIGNGPLDTAQALFGPSSLGVAAAVNKYAISATQADYALGSGDITIEMAIRLSTLGSVVIFDMRPASTNGAYPALSTNSSGDLFYFVGGATRITGSAVLGTNRWDVIAVSRVSGTTRMFVNGVQAGSNYTDGNNYLQSRVVLGASSFTLGQTPINGWADELRITKGTGRYSANYSVATAAFPNA